MQRLWPTYAVESAVSVTEAKLCMEFQYLLFGGRRTRRTLTNHHSHLFSLNSYFPSPFLSYFTLCEWAGRAILCSFKSIFTNCDTHTNQLLAHFLIASLIFQHCAMRFPLCWDLPHARSRKLITYMPCGLQEQKKDQVLCHNWVCHSCPKEPGWNA